MYGIYCRLGVHVLDSNLTLIRKARKVISPAHRKGMEKKEERKRFYRLMMEYHRQAFITYAMVMGGQYK